MEPVGFVSVFHAAMLVERGERHRTPHVGTADAALSQAVCADTADANTRAKVLRMVEVFMVAVSFAMICKVAKMLLKCVFC